MRIFRTHYGRDYFESFMFREKPGAQRNRNRLSEILPLKSDGRLLEIGCGTGGFLDQAARHFHVECMDVSAYAVEKMQERGYAARQGNIEQVELPQDRYDVVAIYNVLEHLRNPGAALAKIYASLRPGGMIAGSFPNKFGVVGRIHTTLTNLFDATHVSTFTPRKWRTLFDAAGFEDARFFGELTFGRNRSLHVHHRAWGWVSFNLMFLARK